MIPKGYEIAWMNACTDAWGHHQVIGDVVVAARALSATSIGRIFQGTPAVTFEMSEIVLACDAESREARATNTRTAQI